MKTGLAKPLLHTVVLPALLIAPGIGSSAHAQDYAPTYGCQTSDSCSAHKPGQVGFIENAINCMIGVCCSSCHSASLDTRKSNSEQMQDRRFSVEAFKREHRQAIQVTRQKIQRERPDGRDIRQMLAPLPQQKVDREYQDLYKALTR